MSALSERSTASDAPVRPRLSLLAVAAAMLLLQAVWILAVPPFGATDEFDHVYRAASVARGEWRAQPSDATRGTGAVVTVPDDVVAAARPECQRLPYTEDGDCVGVKTASGTEVATGAGRYHPAFYAAVGVPALPFDGTAALYVMRAVNALLCCGLVLAAFAALRAWVVSPWPYLALLLACSPVVFFSFSMAAPNGLEMAAAAGLWAALLGIFRDPGTDRLKLLLTVGTVSACVLVTVRSLGPVWALFILAAVLVATPSRWQMLARVVRRRHVPLCAGIVLVAALASAAWILTTGSLVIGKLPEPPTLSTSERVGTLLKSAAQWIFQSIGAFPFRNMPAPAAVYVSYLFLVTWLLILALRSAARPERRGIVVVITVSLLFPLVLTWVTMDDFGFSWQGRYTIPFSMGFLLLCGAALDGRRRVLPPVVLGLGALLFGIAQAYSPADVAHGERLLSPGFDNGAWLLVPPWVLGVVGLAASAWLWLAVCRPTREPVP